MELGWIDITATKSKETRYSEMTYVAGLFIKFNPTFGSFQYDNNVFAK